MTATILPMRPIKRFTPAGCEGQPNAPVYLLAQPTYRHRAQFRAAVAGEGVRYPTDGEIAQAMLDAIDETAPDNRDELKATIRTFIDMAVTPYPPPAPDATAEQQAAFGAEIERRTIVFRAYTVLLDILRTHPRVASLLSMRTLFGEMIGPLAAGIALLGWENGPGEFRRVGNTVPDDVLALLPEEHLIALGNEVLATMALLGKMLVPAAPEPAPVPPAAEEEPGAVTDLAKARSRQTRKPKTT